MQLRNKDMFKRCAQICGGDQININPKHVLSDSAAKMSTLCQNTGKQKMFKEKRAKTISKTSRMEKNKYMNRRSSSSNILIKHRSGIADRR